MSEKRIITIRSGNKEVRMEATEGEYRRYFRPWWRQKKREQRNREAMEEKGYTEESYAFGELTVQTTNADGSMRSLGDILTDCRAAFAQLSESERAANAEALVGKNAMSGFLAVMNAASGDIEKLNGAINNCDGTAERMAETMQDNLAGQLTILKSQLEELAISIGEILMPSIRQIVGWIQGLVDWLNGLDEGTKKVIVTVALVAAALGPVLIVVGKVVGAVGTILTVIPKIAGAVSGVAGFVSGTVIPALSAVVAAIGWVPIAIAAVIGAVAVGG